MTTVAKQAKAYVAANGGHAAVAAAISVPAHHLAAWTRGQIAATPVLAIAMAPLLSLRVNAILAEDPDRQFLDARGAV